MKKIVPIIVIIFLLIGAAGYLFFTQKGKSSGLSGDTATQPKSVAEQGFVSIREAIAKKISLKCEYPDDKGNIVTSYIKGEMVRVMGYLSGEGDQGNMLMRDNKLYIWDDQTKKGTMMMLSQPTGIQSAEKSNQTTSLTDKKTETIENMEKYKNYCKVEAVADSVFTVPTDVQFIDWEEQMKDAGINIPKTMEQNQVLPPSIDEE